MKNKKLKSGIYCIENTFNQKKYIGRSLDVETRLKRHFNDLNNGNHFNIHLQRAWNRYGKKYFKFYIINLFNPKLILEKEIYYIKKLKTKNKRYGYNLTNGGDGGNGAKWTKEQRRRVSGKNHPMFGKPAYNKGVPMSAEQKIKLSGENHWNTKGKNNPMFGKSGIKAPMFEKKMDCRSSKYFGVCIKRTDNRIYWDAYIHVDKKKIHIKTCKKEVDAAKEYDNFIIKNKIRNRTLNFK